MHGWFSTLLLIVLAWAVWRLIGPSGAARSGCSCCCGGRDDKSSGACCGTGSAHTDTTAQMTAEEAADGASAAKQLPAEQNPSHAKASAPASYTSGSNGALLFVAGLALGLLVAGTGFLGRLFGPMFGPMFGPGFGHGWHGFGMMHGMGGMFSGLFGILLLALVVGVVWRLTRR